MLFRINTNDINYAMNMVTRAIAARPVKQNYEGVLIETKDDGIQFTCTDGEITVKTSAAAQISEGGTTVMPAKLLAELMRRQSGGDVEMKIDDNSSALIRSHGSSTNMVGMTAEDFPEISDITGQQIKLPCGKLRNAISRVMFAVSTDESRKALTGVLLETYAEETRLVGLDGFRLALQCVEAKNDIPAGKEMISAIIPGRVMNEISRMLPEDHEKEVTLTFNATHMMASFDNVKIYSTLLMGEFIDYKHILPDKRTTEIVVEKAPFGEALERCGLIAREGKNNLIMLNLSENGMVMTSRAERGDVHEEMPIIFNGEPLKIAFNSHYLTDVIKNVEDGDIRMCFNSSVSPCLVRPVEGNQFTFLVLPVRTYDA